MSLTTQSGSSVVVVNHEDMLLALDTFLHCVVLGRASEDPRRREAAEELAFVQLVRSSECSPRCALVRGRLAHLLADKDTCWVMLGRILPDWFRNDEPVTRRVLH